MGKRIGKRQSGYDSNSSLFVLNHGSLHHVLIRVHYLVFYTVISIHFIAFITKIVHFKGLFKTKYKEVQKLMFSLYYSLGKILIIDSRLSIDSIPYNSV